MHFGALLELSFLKGKAMELNGRGFLTGTSLQNPIWLLNLQYKPH